MRFYALSVIFCWSLCFMAVKAKPYSSDENELSDNAADEHNYAAAILDDMNVEELLSVATRGNYSVKLIADSFQRKYSEMEVCFGSSLEVVAETMGGKHSKIIFKHQEAEGALKLIGPVITSVTIVYANLSSDQSKQITEFISDYCSVLEELTLIEFTSNPLVSIPKWFSHVKHLTLIGQTETLGNETAKLNDMFPALTHLDLIVKDIEQQSCIDLEYPHLESFSTFFSIPGQLVSFDEFVIEDMFRKNPNIKSLKVYMESISFLQKVNEILPKLEELHMTSLLEPIEYSEGVCFDNVKFFWINAVTDAIPSNVIFDQLEHIKFEGFRPISNGWINYFGRFPTVKYFNMIHSTIHSEQLERLARRLPNLEMASLIIDVDVIISDVIEFIEKSKKLTKLHLVISNAIQMESFGDEAIGEFKMTRRWNDASQTGAILFET